MPRNLTRDIQSRLKDFYGMAGIPFRQFLDPSVLGEQTGQPNDPFIQPRAESFNQRKILMNALASRRRTLGSTLGGRSR